MPEVINVESQCPGCGAVTVLIRAFAGAGQSYIADRTVNCPCGCNYIASAAMISGAPAPVGVWRIPDLAGDAGGIDALLLG